ncbi:MAG: hypothetical protein ACOYN6_08890 [Ignavibacteria bacterium]|nr:hypothetical protein [Ignavibacteriota bacterium]
MKKTFLTLFLGIMLFAFVPKTFSQSAVYFCTETGAYGYAHGYSYSDVFTKAYDACINYGGTAPVLITSTENKGYGAIALGTDANGNRVIGVALGYSTLSAAKSEALSQCENYGGYGAYISDTFNDN